MFLGACTQSDARTPAVGPTATARSSEALRIAVLADLPASTARSLDLPAADGVELAVARRGGRAGGAVVTAELGDLTDDPAIATAAVDDLISDPTVVAVVIAPFTAPARPALDALAAAGMPAVVLSPDVVVEGVPAWRRMAPHARAQAHGSAAAIRSISAVGDRDVCLVGPRGAGRLMPELASVVDPPRRSRIGLDPSLEPEDSSEVAHGPITAAVRAIADAGCAGVVWTGGPVAGGAVRAALRTRRAAGGPVPATFVVTDAARTGAFVDASSGEGDGAYGLCACVDLSTGRSLDGQRFVNDFQFAAGTAPGPYAVEGFDAGALLLEAIDVAGTAGQPDRGAVAARLRSIDTFDGLARRWVFSETPVPDPVVRLSRVTGGRWQQQPS